MCVHKNLCDDKIESRVFFLFHFKHWPNIFFVFQNPFRSIFPKLSITEIVHDLMVNNSIKFRTTNFDNVDGKKLNSNFRKFNRLCGDAQNLQTLKLLIFLKKKAKLVQSIRTNIKKNCKYLNTSANKSKFVI